MLSYLKIENIAIIEKAEIEFSKGFNVLSGETGAGKSIILDSIGAVAGFRTSRELIRTGETKASVTALFSDISDGVREKLLAYGLECEEDGTLLLSRVIGQDKNICKVNKEVVTVSTLREIGSALINIHGQQDSRDLLDSNKHLFYIDKAANNDEQLLEMEKLYEKYINTKKEIQALTVSDEQKARLTDMLQYEINELSLANIKIGEREQLKSRRAVIMNFERLEQLIGDAKRAVNGDGEIGAYDLLSEASNALLKASELDDTLGNLSDSVTDIMYTLQNAAQEIREKYDELECDTNELNEIEERLDLLYRLGRKYGEREENMLSYLEKAEEKLGSLIYSDEKIKKLKEQSVKELKLCKDMAETLSQRRKKAAESFENAVSNELVFLDMPYVKFKTSFEKAELSASGFDNAEFLISANIGEELKPVAKIASGGELSRIMLSFKNVISDKDGTDTLIFDEVDQGISGRAALKVGQKLKEASKNRQVICVTHLSQIAAFADFHFLIEKRTHDKKTLTDITPLNIEGRKRELARITGGGEITDIQLKNAEELLEYGRAHS